MTLRRTITGIIAGLVAITVLASFLLARQSVHVLQAATSDNVYGWAWGSSDGEGMGWLKLNNCNNPLDVGTCSGPDFGVSIDTNGQFSGYGWSSNYGWVNFSGASHCPGGAPQVDLEQVATAGSAPVTGFAHIVNGNSGDAFWDGCLGMSGSWSDGVTVNSGGTITGFAWGDEVVGWVEFYGEYTLSIEGCTDDTAENYTSGATIDDGSCYWEDDVLCMNGPWSYIDSTEALEEYNDDALVQGDPILIYDSSTGLCALEDDLCPDNFNSTWDGIQDQAWIDNYESTNGVEITYVSGYCTVLGVGPEICGDGEDNDQDGLIDESPPCLSVGGGGTVTIPEFEEI